MTNRTKLLALLLATTAVAFSAVASAAGTLSQSQPQVPVTDMPPVADERQQHLAQGAEVDSASRPTHVAPAVLTPQECPAGTLPLLTIERFPTAATGGAATLDDAAGALNLANPTYLPMAKLSRAPVWITASGKTYLGTPLADGTWFVSAALVENCVPPPPRRTPPPPGPPRG